jgi:hypothetical protein
MYKIVENGQIIDVLETLQFVKCLPKTQKTIIVDERQTNGIVSSNTNEIYHLLNTPNTFSEPKKTVSFYKIDLDEYNRLTTQLKENETLEKKVEELERIIKELYSKLA